MPNPLLSVANSLRPKAASYAGGAWNRLNADWLMSRLSADQAMRFDIQTLRNRARDLVMNNGSAAAIPGIFSENVIGKDGITFQAKIESTRGKQNDRVNELLETQWELWGEKGNCTVDGRSAFTDVERMIVENEAVDGEVLIRLVRGFPNAWGFALDVLDPDQLDNFYNVTGSDSQNQITMGVEMDRWHRPVFYHLWTQHPTEPTAKIRERVPASEIIHLFIQRRPRQSRAVTWFAPVVIDLKMLGGYREAELVAARTASAKQGFITTSADAAPPATADPNSSSIAVSWNAEPGVMERLQPGEGFAAWAPDHPSAAFDGFNKAILRSIAGALRQSYMSLSGDLSGTSFGSGRIGMLAERAVYQAMQQRLIRQIHTLIYRAWLQMAILSGALNLPSSDVTQYYAVEWHPRVFPWIDPLKDMGGLEYEVAMGLTSLTRACAERGRDFEEVMLERAAEIQLADSLGVPLIISTGTSRKGVTVDEAAPDQAAPDESAPSDQNAAPKPVKKSAMLLRLLAANGES